MKNFFGWLFLTEKYLDTLTDEQVAIRALGRRGYYKWEKQKREIEARIRASDAALHALVASWSKK